MSTRTIWKCDLCREEVDYKDIHGWECSRSYATGERFNGKYTLVDGNQDCGDRHICKYCVQDIAQSIARSKR